MALEEPVQRVIEVAGRLKIDGVTGVEAYHL
jgi:hypothetical protein